MSLFENPGTVSSCFIIHILVNPSLVNVGMKVNIPVEKQRFNQHRRSLLGITLKFWT